MRGVRERVTWNKCALGFKTYNHVWQSTKLKEQSDEGNTQIGSL